MLKGTACPDRSYNTNYQLFKYKKTGQSQPVIYFYPDIRIMTFRQQSRPESLSGNRC